MPRLTPLQWMLVLMALYIPYQSYLDIGTGIPAVNLLNLGFVAALFLILSDPKRERQNAPLKIGISLYICTITAALLHSIVRGDHPLMLDITYYKTALFYPLLFFLYFHGAKDKRSVELIFVAILFVTTVAALQAFRQGLDWGFENFNETRRASGPFPGATNANRAGVFFSMFTPVAMVVALMYRERLWVRLLAWSGVMLGIVGTFATYSRQSYAILAVVLMIFLMRKKLLLGAILGIALLNYQLWIPDAALQRIGMTQTVNERGEAKLEESTESRFVLWKGAALMLEDHPLGVGLDRFKDEIGNYSPYSNKDAHNFYVLFTAEGGYVAAPVILVLVFSSLLISLPLFRLKGDNNAQILAWSHLLCSIAFALGNLYGSPFYYGELTGCYWALSGIAARYPLLRSPKSPAAATAVLSSTGPPAVRRAPPIRSQGFKARVSRIL